MHNYCFNHKLMTVNLKLCDSWTVLTSQRMKFVVTSQKMYEPTLTSEMKPPFFFHQLNTQKNFSTSSAVH